MKRRLQSLTTFNQVVKAFGGPVAVGRITEQSCAAVCNWRSYSGLFPSKYYHTINEALEPLGYCAPASLFNFHVRAENQNKAA